MANKTKAINSIPTSFDNAKVVALREDQSLLLL